MYLYTSMGLNAFQIRHAYILYVHSTEWINDITFHNRELRQTFEECDTHIHNIHIFNYSVVFSTAAKLLPLHLFTYRCQRLSAGSNPDIRLCEIGSRSGAMEIHDSPPS